MSPQDKFAKAYDMYADAIFRHCLLRVYDRELAKDLMQETFTKAWNYLLEGNDIDNVKALLYRIATNLIIDHSRKPSTKKTQSLEDMMEAGFEPQEEGGDSEKRHQEQLDAKEALKVLKHVKDQYREVLVLRYIDDLSVKQIAKLLGISENLTSVRLNRGLAELRKRIQAH